MLIRTFGNCGISIKSIFRELEIGFWTERCGTEVSSEKKQNKTFNYDSSFFPILVWRENPNHKQLSRQLKQKRTFIISASLFPLYLVNSWLLPYLEVSVVLTNHISQQLCTMTQYNSARLLRLLSLLWCYKGHSFSHTLVMGL